MGNQDDLIKQFYSVINRKYLTDEIFNALVERFELTGIDLEAEQQKINQRKSVLTASRRKAVGELLILKKMLEEKKLAEANEQNMNVSTDNNIGNDQIIAGDIPTFTPNASAQNDGDTIAPQKEE